MSDSTSSLQLAQDRLKGAGVKDVKFYFDPSALASKPYSELSDGLASFINDYLDDKYSVVEVIGDAPKLS